MQVIYCPGKKHKKPKILLIRDGKSLFIQCHDIDCKRTGTNRGWYQIKENDTGGVSLIPVEEGFRFKLTEEPIAVLEE